MSNEDLLSPTGNSNYPAKQSDSVAAVKKGENKSDVKELKNVSEDSERTGKKRESLIRKKNMDRLNKIHLRRSSGNSDKSPAKTPKQEPAQTRCSISAIPSQEEIVNASKQKTAKKNPEEVVSTSRFKRKAKDVEKPPDSKSNPPVEKPKRSGSKTKAVTAFGTTFHKLESDQPSLPKKRPSSSMDRFRKSKRSKSKEAITEEAGDEPSNNSSQSQLRPSTKHSGLKMSLSKNKLTDMLEDKDLDKGKIKAAFETATGKRARSPYQASSKIETKKQSSKVRMEGDPRHANGKQEEKSEIGKDLSFFEKIQQNVRAYFSPKSSEITKFEEEERKKVQEGEHPENDENIMIWKDGRIKRGFKEDSMRGDQNFFKCIRKERKSDLDKGCNDITNEYFPGQMTARGNGSGPGGKIAYSYGDICKPSIDSQCRRLYYIKRRNCTEKQRTGSFHRSKTFQKNGLAPSAPKSSSSISLILEPDEQVENISSSDGMASALVQIQELHQEINRSVVQRTVNCARGTRNVNAHGDKLTPTVNCEMTAEWVNGCRNSGCRTCRSRLIGSRRKRTAAVTTPKSTTRLRGYGLTIENRTKSEGSIQPCSFIHPVVLVEDFPGRIPLPREKVKPPPKPNEPFVPVHTQWFVYSVTDTKSIQTTRRELPSAESSARNTGQSGIRSERKKSETVPTKKEKAEKKFQDEPPSVTLKDIINLLRTFFNQSSEKVPENRNSRPRSGKDTGDRFAMSRCLAKLMEEKRNYLNLEKTKKLQKSHKTSFISDSFNFFNLLNKEFLSLESSNPRIEELRNVIAQKKEPEIEEYLEMYKRVIRMSLTEPEQYLMDKAKKELEHYMDMYYDLMKRICLDKEGKGGSTFPSAKSSEKHREKVNGSEMVKSKVKKSAKPLDNLSEKEKTRIEKPRLAKGQESRVNRESDTGRCHATNNLKTGGTVSVHARDRNANDSKTKPVVELLGFQKNDESQLDSDGRKGPEEEEDPSSGGKVFLALSLCDDGLLVKHAEDSSEDFPDGEDKGPTSHPSQDDEHESSEALPDSSQINKSHSGYVRADSDTTVYPKCSIYENDCSENRLEQSVLRLKAFRKILRGGLTNFALFDEAEGEDEQWRMIKGELEDKSPHKDMKTLTKDGKKGSDGKHKSGADSMIYTTREERIKKRIYQKRSNSFSRSASPNEKEDATKRVPWWRKDSFAPTNSRASKVRKSYQARKTENYRPAKRTVQKTTRETRSREEKEKRKIEMEEKIEEEPPKSGSQFETPPESFSEWRFGLKDLQELLQDIPARIPNLDGVSGAELVCPDEEERELTKLNLSGSDENGDEILEKQEPPVCTGRKTSLRIGFNNPLKAEWMEEAPLMDYQKVAEVLNQFLGSVAEVWKAAASLKDLIQPPAAKEEDSPSPQTPEPEEDTGDQVHNNHGIIESFKNFLRILTTIFEDDPREEVIRKQLCLLKKELIEHSHGSVHSAPQPEAGERTRFVREIAEIPREVREMIANELTSDGGESEDVEPAFILAAVKKIGEKLKESYFCDEGEIQNDGAKSECQPQKIYYRPEKKPSQEGKEGSAMKSNLGNLVEKIRKLCREKNAKDRPNEKCSLNNNASLDTRSSVYFDAADTVLHPGDLTQSTEDGNADGIDKVTLSPIDESYFSLNSSNFEKYRSLIYDKIITFLRSDDERSVNYGIALLGKMIDRDESSPVKIERKVSRAKDERERKWQDLLDKLMETCEMIETEMKKEVEKCAGLEQQDEEKKMEVERTCEYLKCYVNRMKSLIKELKLPDDAVQRVRALENSRETNKERQLVSSGAKFPARQKYLLDNAMDFINSIGNIGYSFEKFPFFPKGFGLNGSEKKTCLDMDTFRNEVSNELLLEGNKTMVKSLRKNIEKRQRKIEGMIEEAGNGASPAESLLGDKIARKVRDLKKYYLLLEKMICDPTTSPPKWLKLDGSDGKSGNRGKPTKKGETSVMTMLEDLMKQVSVERKTLKYSKSTISADSRNKGFPSPPSAGSLTLVKIKYETLNVECPAQSRDSIATKDVAGEIENGVPLRPVTA